RSFEIAIIGTSYIYLNPIPLAIVGDSNCQAMVCLLSLTLFNLNCKGYRQFFSFTLTLSLKYCLVVFSSLLSWLTNASTPVNLCSSLINSCHLITSSSP